MQNWLFYFHGRQPDRPTRSLRFGAGKIGRNNLPVHDLEERRGVVWSAILEVDIVGVLPDIHRQHRALCALGHAGIASVHDLELRVGGVVHQPGPAGAEVAHRLVHEGSLEGIHTFEVLGQGSLQLGRHAARGIGLHGCEVEGVVEVLGRLVEEWPVTVRLGLHGDGLNGLALQLVPQDLVQLCHIGVVVLRVVQLQLVGTEDRRATLLPVERQLGQCGAARGLGQRWQGGVGAGLGSTEDCPLHGDE
mmetsp:Transcript_35346/g.76301  ORF Transcript_35346/g.76301 Transcript_35346/m.76301 type:complete len:248 (-) Transcript_35346:90-833(-)